MHVVTVYSHVCIQVVAGLRYDLVIEVALSTTCTRESDLCTSVECPIDEHTQSQWMASIVTPPNEMIIYNVISVTPANSVEDTVRSSSQIMPTIPYIYLQGEAAMITPHKLCIVAMLAIGLISFAS